jgi:hypothetical protein
MLRRVRFDPVFVYGNYAEAAVWAAMGAIALFRLRNRVGVALAVLLVAFGISDVVETTTGAWYRPWWMLAWKAACGTAIVAIGLPAYLATRRSRNQKRIDID